MVSIGSKLIYGIWFGFGLFLYEWSHANIESIVIITMSLHNYYLYAHRSNPTSNPAVIIIFCPKPNILRLAKLSHSAL